VPAHEPIDTTGVDLDAPSAADDAPSAHDAPSTDEGAQEPVDLSPAPPEWEPQEPVSEAASPAPEPEASLVDVRDEADEQPDVAAPVPDFTELSPRDVDDDTFFAQLRGALDDDAPLGPREDASGMLRWREEAATAVAEAPSLYDQGEPVRRKFGRKKRRQR
jgi:hypothetical protein